MSVPAPIRLALGSPSDAIALAHSDASPALAVADRSAPAGPASWHPADHLCGDFPRSSARCAHGPRLLRAPTRSTTGSPTVNASPSPAPSGSAASPEHLFHGLRRRSYLLFQQ